MEEFWNKYRCNGCGTCEGVCPEGAIELKVDSKLGVYLPEVDKKKCVGCEKCLAVCPGKKLELDKLNRHVFDQVASNPFLGSYKKLRVGHVLDKELLKCSSSGGIATQTILYALDKGVIDGAILTRLEDEDPLTPKPFIARTREEVLSGMGSKYAPVPLNRILREVVKRKERFAVVGLPCHIQGLRKAQLLDPRLNERIKFCVGLFCAHCTSFQGTLFLLEKYGVDPREVNRIEYRSKGWPGGMTIIPKNGSSKFIPLPEYHGLYFDNHFFIPEACTLCNDHCNELADLSVGDGFLPEKMREGCEGESFIITRTEAGERMINEIIEKKMIETEPLTESDFIRVQRPFLYFKKKNILGRIRFLRLLGRRIPEVDTGLLKPSILSYLGSSIIYANIYFSRSRVGQKIINFTPKPLLRVLKSIVFITNVR